jgi:transposase
MFKELDAQPEKKTPDEVKERDKPEKKSRKGKHPGRSALPAHLAREEVLNPVPPDRRVCPLCGSDMTTVGHERCEILNVRPAQVYVEVRLDERVACPHDNAIVSAHAPPQIVERGKLGDALIVEAVSNKYLNQQPIERQVRHYARQGVEIASQTLGRSVATAIELLAPLASEIHKETHASALLATDATGLPVLDDDHPMGIRNGTIWCWVGDLRWVTFVYVPTGDAQSVKDFLGKDMQRSVQCDGTSVLSFLEREGGTRPGCWSHGRRRFAACARGGDLLAVEALRKIRRLFAVERLARVHNDTPEARLARRAEHSKPVLDDLLAWVTEQYGGVPPKTPLAQALGYLLRQWKRLTLFLTDGRIELTNNRVERELRSLVLGRKNWLFVEGDLGGKRTATILSILGTCIAQQVNPRAYLHTVTKLIVNGWPRARLRELLPDRIVEAHPELRLPARVRPPRAPSPDL